MPTGLLLKKKRHYSSRHVMDMEYMTQLPYSGKFCKNTAWGLKGSGFMG